MPGKPPKINHIEICEMALEQVLRADLTEDNRRILEVALATVTSLRPAGVSLADHMPVEYGPGIIGCACGVVPRSRAQRASMMMSSYHTHLTTIGVPRPDRTPTIRIAWGENEGRTHQDVWGR